MKKWRKISFVFGMLVVGLIFYFYMNVSSQNSENFAFAQTPSLTIITLTKDNKLLGSSEYSISPNPFTNVGNYTIKDNSPDDLEKDKDGIITITGIKNGNYTISQIIAPTGYDVDNLSKIVQVKDSSTVTTFTDSPTSTNSGTSSSIKNITYTAKFECGSIFANEGPLRPGHYDTDISIFNKQSTPTTILWNAVQNDGPSSNAILKNLDSETSTAITCNDVRKTLGNNNENFVEGFVIINIPLDMTLQPQQGTIVRNLAPDQINLLDVHAFYTANSLDTLPHEIVVDKISFYIVQDDSGKIPKEMFRKTLDISLPSNLNELSNTEDKVKSVLAQKYNLTNNDLDKIVVRIKDVTVGVGALIDDHAISLSTLTPEASS